MIPPLAAGWLIYGYVLGLGFMRKVGKRSKKSGKEPTRKADDSEWLKGTHFNPQLKPSRKSSKDLKKMT